MTSSEPFPPDVVVPGVDPRATVRIAAVPAVHAETPRHASLVVVYVPMDNPGAARDLGRRLPLEGTMTIGRDPANTLVLDQPEVSRRHAEVFPSQGRTWVRDTGSVNGTRVNDVDLAGRTVPLNDGDRVTAGSCILKYIESDAENQFHEIIYRLNVEDALTHAANRRYLVDFLDREMARAVRHGRPLSLVMFDLDKFKLVNDRFGHLAGDMVLRETAALVRPYIRRDECFARYGGEEFCVVQPEVGMSGAAALAEKARRAVEGARLTWDGQPVPVTISLGVATLAAGLATSADLVRQADERLYKAKNGGRNRVCLG